MASRICRHASLHCSLSSAIGSINWIHCLFHRCPCFLKPPIGSRSALTVDNHVFFCPPGFFFQCARGRHFKHCLLNESSGRRSVCPNHRRRLALTTSETSGISPHLLLMTLLRTRSERRRPRIQRRHLWWKTFRLLASPALRGHVLQP